MPSCLHGAPEPQRAQWAHFFWIKQCCFSYLHVMSVLGMQSKEMLLRNNISHARKPCILLHSIPMATGGPQSREDLLLYQSKLSWTYFRAVRPKAFILYSVHVAPQHWAAVASVIHKSLTTIKQQWNLKSSKEINIQTMQLMYIFFKKMFSNWDNAPAPMLAP